MMTSTFDTTTPVLLLRLFGHCGVGVARSLGRWGVPVYAVDSEPGAPAAHSRHLRRLFEWDIQRSEPDATIDFLTGVAEQLGGPPILLPTGDIASLFVEDHAEQLHAHFRFPAQPGGLARRIYSKRGLYALCIEHGLPTAATEFPKSAEDVTGFARRTVFPVMIKGVDPRRLQARTGRRLALATDAAELDRLYRQLEDPDSPNLMLQEYIPGTDRDSWMMDAYFDATGGCAFGVTARKIRQYPPEGGVTSLGVCEANPALHAAVCRFAATLGYRGILDTGYRYDRRDGQLKLLDPNPRIGSSFRLFVSTDGMDVARALYLDMTGQPVPATAHPDRRRWFAEDTEIRRAARCLSSPRRAGRLLGWARSFAGVQETAWFARDDMQPFLRMCLSVVGAAVAAETQPGISRRAQFGTVDRRGSRREARDDGSHCRAVAAPMVVADPRYGSRWSGSWPALVGQTA